MSQSEAERQKIKQLVKAEAKSLESKMFGKSQCSAKIFL
jgi:hypothetical protein